ncbi:Ribokinase [Gryllus bimaculatus]|nr:Ribokinase [Gryllus bimaculatus]
MEVSKPRVVVVGSCMIDLVSYAPRLPRAGETLTGRKFQQGFGGKGANQCVAAARLGAETALIARLGDDSFGHEYLKALNKEGVQTGYVSITKEMHTGENQIVIVPGANRNLCVEDVQLAKETIEAAKVLLFQLETPVEATLAALKLAKGKGKRIVNAAPAVLKDTALFTESDIFCINETEAEELLKIPVKSIEDGYKAAEKFRDLGCSAVVITLGSQGAILSTQEDPTPYHIPVKKVQPVDTTGAGDAFLGAMAYYMAYHPQLSLKEIVHRACSVATISVQSPGTQSSFPYRNELPDALL